MKKRVVMFVVVFLFLAGIPGVSRAAVTEEMVRRAWNEVVKTAEMKPLPLSIENNTIPNAWVTNGKSVTVTTGLMNLLEREEEIFGVLSHEAGHAKLNHYASAVTSSVGIGVAGILLDKVIGGSIVGDLAVNVGSNLASAGFSREKEVEADDFAVDLAFKGGKDPTGIYTALERLAYYGGKLQPSGFNSHPPDDRRLLHVKNRIHSRDPNIKITETPKPKQTKEK
ncbi:MAG: M48 family metalloprotease [Synergistaceae bacterium]|jgi:putative metalloprotease|nr:M48 family metalloprotease [Synergistaceae bacterium]